MKDTGRLLHHQPLGWRKSTFQTPLQNLAFTLVTGAEPGPPRPNLNPSSWTTGEDLDFPSVWQTPHGAPQVYAGAINANGKV